jgi:putative hydrolase of HD superfamily
MWGCGTRTGDIPHTAKPYLSGVDNEAIAGEQVARLPESIRKTSRAALTTATA